MQNFAFAGNTAPHEGQSFKFAGIGGAEGAEASGAAGVGAGGAAGVGAGTTTGAGVTFFGIWREEGIDDDSGGRVFLDFLVVFSLRWPARPTNCAKERSRDQRTSIVIPTIVPKATIPMITQR